METGTAQKRITLAFINNKSLILDVGYNVDIDPSAGHTDPSMEFVSQSN